MNARVNQKLYCAKLVLDVVSKSEGAAKSALLEAALFHLITAYRCYLHEIIDSPIIAAPASARDAVQQCQQHDLECKPELSELAQLETANAWPQILLSAYAQVTANTVPIRNVTSGIVLADITSGVEFDNCQKWLAQFQQLLQRQREHAQEW